MVRVSKKKSFFKLFLANNIDNKIIQFSLAEGINYTPFFVLTKLLHSSLIKLQKCEFIDSECSSALFLLNSVDQLAEGYEIINEIQSSFGEIKELFISIKDLSILTLKKLFDRHQVKTISDTLAFINTASKSDNRFKYSSLLQIKSSFNRKLNLYTKRLAYNNSMVENVLDLINFLYFLINEKWQLDPYFPMPEQRTSTTENIKMEISLKDVLAIQDFIMKLGINLDIT